MTSALSKQRSKPTELRSQLLLNIRNAPNHPDGYRDKIPINNNMPRSNSFADAKIRNDFGISKGEAIGILKD